MDRAMVLPVACMRALRDHLVRVRTLHDTDLAEGFGGVWLPDALAVKYPNAARSWQWQWVFPSGRRSTDPRGCEVRRHYLGPHLVQRAVQRAALAAGIVKPVSPHTLPPLFRYEPSGSGTRHPHRPGTVGTQRRKDDDDLYPRARAGRERSSQSAGRAGGVGRLCDVIGPVTPARSIAGREEAIAAPDISGPGVLLPLRCYTALSATRGAG